MQAMDGHEINQIAHVIEEFELLHVGVRGSGRRAVWHKAGWESEAAGKAQDPLVELRHNGQPIATKAEFFAVEREQ